MSAIPPWDPVVIKFAQGSGTSDEVVGTDDVSGLTFQNAVSGNAITRAIWNPGNTDQKGYLIFKRGTIETKRYPLTLLGASLQGPTWAGFPITVAPGTFQVYLLITGGTQAAGTVDFIFEHPLNQ